MTSNFQIKECPDRTLVLCRVLYSIMSLPPKVFFFDPQPKTFSPDFLGDKKLKIFFFLVWINRPFNRFSDLRKPPKMALKKNFRPWTVYFRKKKSTLSRLEFAEISKVDWNLLRYLTLVMYFRMRIFFEVVCLFLWEQVQRSYMVQTGQWWICPH